MQQMMALCEALRYAAHSKKNNKAELNYTPLVGLLPFVVKYCAQLAASLSPKNWSGLKINLLISHSHVQNT